MSNRLHVATRKGLFVLDDTGGGQWHLGEPHFVGEPVTMTLADPRDGTLYAALNLGHFGVKLWRQRTDTAQWEACAVPVYPPKPNTAGAAQDDGTFRDDGTAAPAGNGAPWSLQQIWILEPGGADEPGVLWAGTIPGGLFRSADAGDTWTLIRPLWERPERAEWFGGGYDYPGIHSISVDPRDSRHLTVGVSCGGVWQTRDGGRSWACTSHGMFAAYMPPERRDDANVQDPHRVVHCVAQPDALWAQHHNGIFRSTDGGLQWREVGAQPSSFGFALAVHPREPDTAWFVPAVKDECRIPVGAEFIVTRTRDGGRTFERLSHGLPDAPCYDLVYRHGLAVDESGERLAMGSTTGGLWTSNDGGEHWQCVSEHLPPVYSVRFA
jgi:photosystem II stability/assembly factor-like uncharacterized protein